MKFKIHVQDVKTGQCWWEDYDKPTDDAAKWGQDIVDWFNDTCLEGESHRKFLGAKLL